jgi:signal transduction histidine kinase
LQFEKNGTDMEMQEKSNQDQLIPMDSGRGARTQGANGPDDWAQSLERLMENAVETGRFQIRFTSTVDVKAGFALSPAKREALLQITRETFNNIIKHSKAGSVRINMMQNRSGIIMYIFDDGDGFDLQQVKKRSGLANIYAEASRFNGMVDIITAPGYGCSVTVLIPYD